MSQSTNIQWTDATWNPVRGCSRVSAGCMNCYAERVATRFSGPGQPYEGLINIDEGGRHGGNGRARTGIRGRWNGVVQMVEKHLGDPLKWKKPRRIFVNSMSDLFHEGLSFEDIERVFYIMRHAHWHQFQVLTKRPARMLEFMREDLKISHDLEWKVEGLYPNVWLGVSVENQATADERIPLLLQTPAAVRFLSVEPLLGPVDLTDAVHLGRCLEIGPDPERFRCGLPAGHAGHQHSALHPSGVPWFGKQPVDWVIVGSESGPGARSMDIAWARSVVDQCQTARVSVFVKQIATLEGSRAGDPKGGNPSHWPAGSWPRQFPEAR